MYTTLALQQQPMRWLIQIKHFKAAVDGLMDDSSTPWNPDVNTDDSQAGWVEFFKTEWLHKDGSVSDTTNLQND